VTYIRASTLMLKHHRLSNLYKHLLQQFHFTVEKAVYYAISGIDFSILEERTDISRKFMEKIYVAYVVDTEVKI